MSRYSWIFLSSLSFLSACGSGASATADDETGESSDADSSLSAEVDSSMSGDGDSSSDTGDGESSSDAGDGDGDGEPPPATCEPPQALYDTSSPTAVIGTGTHESCSGADLKSAAEAGGVITFDCGPDPLTITLDETIVLPIDADTIIDGEGLVTLDAQNQTRHFLFDHPDWMNNPNRIVLQRMRFINGAAPAGEYFPQDPENPDCAYGYKEGSGGVLYVRNGIVHILDCVFEDNEAALEGPDIAGGALYVVGVPEVIISGSSFRSNRASNGGAVGMLFANPRIFNSVFEDNQALGIGQNYVEPGCPNFNHDEQGGAGGNSGAVVFDGLNDEGVVYEICGSVFRNNKANELGGALFRTPNAGEREMRIDRSIFDGNTARMGGVSFLMDNLVSVLDTTFMHNRSGVNVAGDEVGGPFGGLWIVNGGLELQNSTFYDNLPNGLSVEGSAAGNVLNASFVESSVSGTITIDNSLFVDTSCDSPSAGTNNLQWPDGSACAGGTTFADPELSSLADNGGPTPNFLPAADGASEGLAFDCPMWDQRGEARQVASCAAGSVEP